MQDRRGQHLYYEVRGDGGPHFLLVHGFLSSRAQWMLNIEALSEFSRPVVIELFGHGRSPSPTEPGAYEPAQYVAEFERIRDALGADAWLVAGQSLGAALTLRYALDHPDRLLAHVFTNSSSALAEDGWTERVRPSMVEQARRLSENGRAVLGAHPLNPALSTRLPAELRAAFRADGALLDSTGIANTGLYTVPASSVRTRVHENRVPSLLVAGAREERFAEYRQFAEATMLELRVAGLDGGHAVNIDCAEEFNRVVTDFCRPYVPRASKKAR